MKQLNRHILKLLMLFVGLFAISNVGWAWDGYQVVIVSGGSGTLKMTWDGSNKYYYYDFPANSNGKAFKLQAYETNNAGTYCYVNNNTHYEWKSLNIGDSGNLANGCSWEDAKTFTISTKDAFRFIAYCENEGWGATKFEAKAIPSVDPPTSYTFYIDISKASNWTTPYVYRYGWSFNDDEVPTNMFTAVAGKNNKIWKVTFDATSKGNLIFANKNEWDGAEQTVDIEGTEVVNNNLYVLKDTNDKGKWTYTRSVWNNQDPVNNGNSDSYNGIWVNLFADFNGDGNWTEDGKKWPEEKTGDEGKEVMWTKQIKGGNGEFALKVYDTSNKTTQWYYYNNNGDVTIPIGKGGYLANQTSSLQKNMKIGDWNSGTTYTIYFRYGGDKQVYISTSTSGGGNNTDFSTNLSRKGKAYLVGDVINDNFPSPAWEFIGTGTTKSLASFAMRYNNKLGVVEYDNDGKPTYYECYNASNANASELDPPHDKEGGYQMHMHYAQVGWTYTAQWNSSTKKLTLTPATFNRKTNPLPYVGILGENFIQATTDSKGLKTRNKYKDGQGNTNMGWQEAYVEYGANGYPVYDNDGTVFYNTVWPPRNNIRMQSYIGSDVDALNISSNTLTMKPVGAKTKSDWETELGEEYKALTDAMDSGKQYLRYKVDNMWMLGDFKIWTGWGGHLQNLDWGALWDTHMYWGPKEYLSNADTQRSYQEIYTGRVYGTSDKSLNFYTKIDEKTQKKSRAYYKTVELFIPYAPDGDKNLFEFYETWTDGNKTSSGSLLYFTASDGGAMIDAIADGKKVGYFPELQDEVPSNYYVTDYVITRYEYDSSVEPENYGNEDGGLSPVTRKLEETSKENALVKTQSFKYSQNIDKNGFNNLFKDLKNLKNNNYIDDGIYSPGFYIFRLEVTYTNELGETKTADVWSPYVQIVDTEFTIPIDGYQLVELSAADKASMGYDYITYDDSDTNSGTSTSRTVTGIQVSDSKVTKASTLTLSSSRINTIYANTGSWTNMVLVKSKTPSLFESQGSSREIEKFDVAYTDNNQNKTVNFEKVNNDYYALIDISENLNNKNLTGTFNGYMNVYSESQKAEQQVRPERPVTASTQVALTVPSPRVKQAYVQTYYGSSEDGDDAPMDFTFRTTAGTEFTIRSARYQNVKEVVEIEAPNVTSDLKNTMGSDFFTYYFQKDVNPTDKSDKIIIGEDGFMPSSAVVPSTLFVANSATGEDKWNKKYVKYESKGTNIYDRGWNSLDAGMITSIVLTDDAPLYDDQKDLSGENATVRVINIKTEFEDDNTENLIGSFDIYVEMKVPEENKNYVEHIEKNVNGDELLHGDTEKGRYDYFFLSVYDMSKGGDGELVLSHPFVGGNATNSEFVAKVEDLHPDDNIGKDDPNVKDDANGPGYTIHVRNNLGVFENGVTWAELLKKHDAYREYIRNLQLRISYIYPFNVDVNAPKNSKARMTSKLEGQIVKSNATTWMLSDATMDPGIATGIEGIYDNAGSIRAGQGFIEVEGQSVAIYNASGICIATAEGRYDVAPGVYVVRLNGATSKVLVK